MEVDLNLLTSFSCQRLNMLCIFTNLCAYKFTHSQQLIKSNNLTGFSVICMPFTLKITDPLHNPTLLRGWGRGLVSQLLLQTIVTIEKKKNTSQYDFTHVVSC